MKKILIYSLLFLFQLTSCSDTSNEPITYNLLDEDPVLNIGSNYMMILGDIQTYTAYDANMPYLEKTMDWIWSQKQYGKNICSILQVGDVSDTNIPSQWEKFYNSTVNVAAEIPYLTVTGNHDYDWDPQSLINDRNSTLINDYAQFPLTMSKVIEAFEPGKIENVIFQNYVGSTRIDIIALEFGPRTEVVEWANEYVAANPDRKFILLTHEWLTRYGERVSSANSYANAQFRNTTKSSPDYVWNHLVKGNDNIICVLCGHNGFSSKLLSTNDAGREVPQILFNLQYLDNGGDGWIEFWEFPYSGDSVNVRIYNTITHKFHPDEANHFKFRYKY